MAVLPLFRDTYMAAWRQVKLKHSISFYIINSVMHAFWLVLIYDLLEDRRIVDDSTRFKFDSCVILWTNRNSLLRIATNQFASFCIDYRLSESAIFVSVKVAKFEVKGLFFRIYFNSLSYKTNRFHVAVRLFYYRSLRKSKCDKNIGDTLGCAFWRHLWSNNEQTHGNMESIC